MRKRRRNELKPISLICVLVISVARLEFFADAVSLSPTSVEEWENSDVIFKCQNDEQNLTSVKWIYNEALEASMVLYSGTCLNYSNFITQNPKLYSFSCKDNEFSVTLRSISQNNHGDIWKCEIPFGGRFITSNAVNIFVKVPVVFSKISPDKTPLTEKENNTVSLECITSNCRPQARFFWYIDDKNETSGNEIILKQFVGNVSSSDLQSYTDVYNITLTRDLNGWFLFCASDNRNSTPVPSSKILLNVTYPPADPPKISNKSTRDEFNVIQNDNVRLECSVTGGNPLPSLAWNKYNESTAYINEDTVITTTFWQETGRDPVVLTCQSIHPYRNDSVNVTVNILYPPDTPEITIQTLSDAYVKLNGTIDVVEGRPFSLNCSAQGNPPVSLFKWNDLPTNISSFNYTKSDRKSETISCYVSNVMLRSDSIPPVTGTNITQLEVNVLYPPKLNSLGDRTIIEGDDVVYPCNFVPGNPSVTNVTWNTNDSTWNAQELRLNNVSRNQAGVYRCSVQNLMIPSDGIKEFGNANGVFNLNVQYRTNVLKLGIDNMIGEENFTVNENDAVNLTCELEGNPLPTGELLHQRETNVLKHHTEALSRNFTSQTSNILRLTSAFLAQCTDTGVQTCRGSSMFYNGSQSTSNKNISLLVMCEPRKSPYFTIHDTVESSTSVNITLSFTALAYPVPPISGYIWARKEETTDTWVTIATNGNKTVISTWGLQSNLTINDVQQFDYGLYRISIENDIGRFNHTFNLIPAASITDGSSHPSYTVTVVAAGAAAGGFAILMAVIIIVVVYKRRLKNKKNNVSSKLNDFKILKENGYMDLKFDDQQSSFSNDHEQSPAVPVRQPTRNDVHGLQELDDFDENIITDYAVYGNASEMIKRIERVDVIELFPYLVDKTAEYFAADFAKLPHGLTKSYEFSQKPENIALNRYHGIYPYDHSRVKIPSIPLYFINACYIDGYKRKRAYIATLGPLSDTTNKFVSFWQMVWSEKSDVIVMLTKLTEPSGVKCDQYWPKHGTSCIYGEFTVTSTKEEIYSDFVTRKFSIFKGGQKRKLTHFHFTAWPDKSIPEDAICLLEFRRRVKANHSSGPIIVHCSAGIGRTGTLMAIDILIEEGQAKGSVNVFECVKKMREQRTNMVQTVDQYYYIFKALVNALVFDNEAIPEDKFHKYIESSKINRLSDMFQKFNQSVETENPKETNSRNANNIMVEKNREGSDIPGDAHRVRLVFNKGMRTSDYVNAVYLNSFKAADHFIAAQSPLLNGVEDFLCMIYQEKCCCVVSMDGEQARQSVGSYVPPDNSSITAGIYNVQCSRLETKENYIIRKLKLEITGQVKGAEQVVYHFQFLGWLHGNKVPNDPRQFVELTIDIERFACQFGTEGSRVLVHCLNAYERSCLLCSVVTLTEKIKHEKVVCVPNTLRQIRTRRKLSIPTLEQFKFCYQAVDAYVSMHKAGTNNAENSYMNMSVV